jgi:long-chain acyl-CoA synthetase
MTNSSKLTLPELFSNSVENFGNETSVVFTEEKNYTYKQMGNDVDLLAGML